MMQNFRSQPYESLVREAVQNSLDAVDDRTKPVKVVFSVGIMKSQNYPNFFELSDHILACGDYYDWNDKAVEYYQRMEDSLTSFKLDGNSLFPYIKVSDYNTKGMKYDNTTKSPFYAFALAGGVSAKVDQESGGSFGFGKSAYFQLSTISSVLVSTLTNEGQHVFEGVSWLCTHEYQGEKVQAVGFYDNNSGKPIVDNERIPQEFRRDRNGSDFYILGFKLDVDAIEDMKTQMIEEALRSFWLAIHEERLIINVLGVIISKDNLKEMMEQHFPDLIDKSRKANPHPYFVAVSEYGANKNCFRFNENIPILGEVTLYLIKCKDVKDKIMYMRKPLMMVYAKKRSSYLGLYGVFICANEKGDKILQSLENPAHDIWDKGNWKAADGFHINPVGKQALDEIQDFITNCIERVFATNQETALDITGLNDYLYIPENLVDDEDSEADHLVGSPTGKTKDEGVSLTTQISTLNKKDDNSDEKTNIGSVRIIERGSHDAASSEDGKDVVAGTSNRRPHTKIPGGKPGAGNRFEETTINNKQGTYKTYLPVQFRVVAQKIADGYEHKLIIHCPRDVIQGELELITIGEQIDDVVDVVYTDNGEIKGNLLTDVILDEGRNIITIKFKDKMRHALKLKAYENQ